VLLKLPLLILAVFATGKSFGMSTLVGQRVLITGAGRGIGRAIAQIFHAEGACVALTARTEAQLHETASMLQTNERVSIHVADVTDAALVEEMVRQVVAKWGGIDILINNAGGSQAGKAPLQELDPEDLIQVLNLNVVAVHRVTKAVLQQTQPTRIINISSKAGKVGLPNFSFYVASKHALEGLTASWAEELKDVAIVNSISPGMVDTVSFPKPPGRSGVRSAESVKDGLMLLLRTNVTGHYLHVDELDEVRGRGLDDSVALKPINEPDFVSQLSS
jgi:NAD(P)-dependent dehydrogenase (short-subunit alcohol dehydrogenase family)